MIPAFKYAQKNVYVVTPYQKDKCTLLLLEKCYCICENGYNMQRYRKHTRNKKFPSLGTKFIPDTQNKFATCDGSYVHANILH